MKIKSIIQYSNKDIRISLELYRNGTIHNRSVIRLKCNEKEKGKRWYYKHYKNNKLKIIKYLGGKCQRCGLISPYSEIYDVHHLSNNKNHYKNNFSNKSFETIKNELDECILLCSNCHRIIHSKED